MTTAGSGQGKVASHLESPQTTAPSGRKVLLVTQLPSDFTEMSRVAEALHRRGHSVYFVHHPARHDQIDGDPVVQRLRELKAAGEIEDFDLVFELPKTISRPPEPVPKTEPPTHEMRWPERSQRWLYELFTKRRDTGILPDNIYPVTNWIFRQIAAIPRSIDNAVRFVRKWCWYEPKYKFEKWCYWSRVYLKERVFAVPRYIHALVQLYATRYQTYGEILSRRGIQCILLPEDIVGMVSPLLIKAARKAGCGTVILPYTIANQQEAFRSLSVHGDYQSRDFINRVAGLLFRRWRMRDDKHDVVRLPGAHIVAHEWLRVTPPDPWMMNSGFADVVAVENEAMRDYYGAAGIAAEKMSVVGAVYDDALFEARRSRSRQLKELRNQLGLSSDKPLLLIGGCPDQISACPGSDFSSMREAVAFMAESLRPMQAHYNIVVRPHPNYLPMAAEFARHGIPSSMIDTVRLVAASDAYIAFASATIRWAIACGIPTINYDLFQYNYDDFRNVPGVVEARTQDDFRAAVAALRPDGEAFARQSAQITASSRRWSMFDGRCVERIEGLVDRYSRRVA